VGALELGEVGAVVETGACVAFTGAAVVRTGCGDDDVGTTGPGVVATGAAVGRTGCWDDVGAAGLGEAVVGAGVATGIAVVPVGVAPELSREHVAASKTTSFRHWAIE
jgi:hypothetical protein